MAATKNEKFHLMMSKDTKQFVVNIGGSRELQQLLDYMRDYELKPQQVISLLEDKKHSQIQANKTIERLKREMSKASEYLGIIEENGTKRN